MKGDGIRAGALVESTAGHDKGRSYIVLRAEDDFVWAADGKHRGLNSPKKKRKKHVALKQGETSLSELSCDAHVRKAIKRLKTEGGCHLG